MQPRTLRCESRGSLFCAADVPARSTPSASALLDHSAERPIRRGLSRRQACRRVRDSARGGQSTHDYPPRAARTAPTATDSPVIGRPAPRWRRDTRRVATGHRSDQGRARPRRSRRPSRVARQAKSWVDERRRAGYPQAGVCDLRALARHRLLRRDSQVARKWAPARHRLLRRRKKRAPMWRPRRYCRLSFQSRCPVNASSRLSRLMKMLSRSRYRFIVAMT